MRSRQKKAGRPKPALSSTTFLVFLPAAAGTWVIAAGFLIRVGLFLIARIRSTSHELQIGHLLLFLAMDVSREVLHGVLGCQALIGLDRHHLRFVFFFLF